eukprot:TRINITY_DN4974_c0_g1_i1.p1 TRINITY_DN4974_c0_g1~~TRINITY_DN4974_c0_g1_i1.p1  ORF type:complete len:501 (+),score=105.77 TRINITY_DN4974_c0_g1_i1:70-1572(+)
MSVTTEVYRVLKSVRRTDRHNRHDGVSSMLSYSPPSTPPDSEAMLNQEEPKLRIRLPPGSAPVDAREVREAQQRCKVVQFERTTTADPSKFAKIEISSSENMDSLLSQLLNKGNEIAFDLDTPPLDPSARVLELSIFVGWNKGKKFSIRVAETSTVSQVIIISMKHYAAHRLQPALQQDPMAYVLRMVDDDGTPDDDFPALDRARQINKFQFKAYALCEAPKSARMSVNMSESIDRVTYLNNLMTPAATAGKGNLFLRVQLPQGDYNIVNVSPDMLIGDLLNLITKKRNLDPAKYCFQHPTIPGAIPADRTIQSLNTENILLCPSRTLHGKKVPDQLPFTPAMSPAMGNEFEIPGSVIEDDAQLMVPVFSEFTASQYKEYDVYKTNKHGVRQERIMGIDREKIYNMLPKNANGFLGSKAAKRPSRYIEDVHSIRLEEDRPSFFTIVFKEGGNQYSMEYSFEAKGGPVIASEIVAKVEFLLRLIDRPNPVTDPVLLSPKHR